MHKNGAQFFALQNTPCFTWGKQAGNTMVALYQC